jgi:hypothetical protein
MLRRAIDRIQSLYQGCRHEQQNIVGRRLAAGAQEMYLVCGLCRKRLSSGISFGKPVWRVVKHRPEPGNEFVPLGSGAD